MPQGLHAGSCGQGATVPPGTVPPGLVPFLDPAPLPPGPSLIGMGAPMESADPTSLEELGLEELLGDAAARAAGCDLASLYRILPAEESSS
jgi:hypothetical protein